MNSSFNNNTVSEFTFSNDFSGSRRLETPRPPVPPRPRPNYILPPLPPLPITTSVSISSPEFEETIVPDIDTTQEDSIFDQIIDEVRDDFLEGRENNFEDQDNFLEGRENNFLEGRENNFDENQTIDENQSDRSNSTVITPVTTPRTTLVTTPRTTLVTTPRTTPEQIEQKVNVEQTTIHQDDLSDNSDYEMDFMKRVARVQHDSFEELTDQYYTFLDNLYEMENNKVSVPDQLALVNEITTLNSKVNKIKRKLKDLNLQIKNSQIVLSKETKKELKEKERTENIINKFMPFIIAYSMMEE